MQPSPLATTTLLACSDLVVDDDDALPISRAPRILENAFARLAHITNTQASRVLGVYQRLNFPMDHRPRKRFGQNFLHDPGIIQRILDAVAATPSDRLVEIGPGLGAITAGLLKSAGDLHVVELDRDLIQTLEARFGGVATDGRGLHIHHADALPFDLCALAMSKNGEQSDRPRLRLIGNLPYNISTPLLFRFIAQASCIEDMHLMLQKEVVDRITASPGSKVYGRLSVMVQTFCEAQRLFVVASGAFHPAPKVDSAVIRLSPYRQLPNPINDIERHAQIVAAAFSQRRKTLRNSLRALVSPEQMRSLDIAPSARAETLTVANFAALAEASDATAS
jgi:16S rRNA (adenine1518-N6/adenine1519-N6)-dimethyltransferase